MQRHAKLLSHQSEQAQEAGAKVPAVVDLQWVPEQTGYLAAVYYSAYVILWNVSTSTKVMSGHSHSSLTIVIALALRYRRLRTCDCVQSVRLDAASDRH